METLPVEILERIICSQNLSISDVVNFSLTNRYNNLVVTNCDSIWKKEFFKTWPQFVEIFDKKFNNDWYEEGQYIYDLKRRTREIFSTMSTRFYKRSNVLSSSDFTEWFELYQEKPQTYHYLIDDLINIVNTDYPIQSIEVVPITTPGNKTLQYYAMQVLSYLRQLHLTKEWRTFIALPPKLQTLEKGIAFIGQWFQPHSVLWMNFGEELDKLTEKVKENLKMAHPDHPLFDVPEEQLEMWRNENVECYKYDSSHCMQIQSAVTKELNCQFDYPFKNIFLTVTLLADVLNCEVNIIMLIIYETVGRRLGIKYEPIVTTGLYLRSSGSNNCEEHQYIDFDYDFYRFVPMFLLQHSSAVATTQQVVEYITKQVVQGSSIGRLTNKSTVERLCSCLKFLNLVSSFDDVTRLCLHYYETDAKSYIRVEHLLQQKNQAPNQIESIINQLQQYETGRDQCGRLFPKVESKVRPKNLKYAVGMVMEHGAVNFSSTFLCVICDWYCSASDKEPFYNILYPSGKYLHVAQGKLMMLPRIDSSSELLTWCFKDIGWHFSHRFETIFVPNAEKEREYPEDTALRNTYNDRIKPLV